MKSEIRYLAADVTGPSSRIEYGKQGDEVTVINADRDFWVVENKTNGQKFGVRPSGLTSSKQGAISPSAVTKDKQLPASSSSRWKNKSSSKQATEPQLF